MIAGFKGSRGQGFEGHKKPILNLNMSLGMCRGSCSWTALAIKPPRSKPSRGEEVRYDSNDKSGLNSKFKC